MEPQSESPISVGRAARVIWIAVCLAVVSFSVFFAILPRIRANRAKEDEQAWKPRNAELQRAFEEAQKNPEFQKKVDEAVAGFPEEQREERKRMFSLMLKHSSALSDPDAPAEERQKAWSEVFGVSIDLKPFVKALKDEDFESARAFLGPDTRKEWTKSKFSAQMKSIRKLAGKHWDPEQTGFVDDSCPEGRFAEATFRLAGSGGPKLGLEVSIRGTDEGFKIVFLTLVTEKGEELLMQPQTGSAPPPAQPDGHD
ncbi:MAG: hypothetical protein ABIF82_03535 [Planctomycetota bacterium]